MGSGLDLTCLNYRKVAAFVAAANKELNRLDSHLSNHPNRELLADIIGHAYTFSNYNVVEFGRSAADPEPVNILVSGMGLPIINANEENTVHSIEDLATLTHYFTGPNAFILNPDLSDDVISLIIDEVDAVNIIDELRAFEHAYTAFYLVWKILASASDDVPSAGHIAGIEADLTQYFSVSDTPFIRSNASDNAAEAVCALKSLKFPQGTSLQKCDILLSTHNFRLFSGSLASLVSAKRECWKGAVVAPGPSYLVCRPRWCRRMERALPTVERCELINAGVYRAFDCSPIVGLDAHLDAAALAALVNKNDEEANE